MNLRPVHYAEDLTSHTSDSGATGVTLSYTGTVGENEWVLASTTAGFDAGNNISIFYPVGAGGLDVTPIATGDFYNFPGLYPGQVTLPSGTPNFSDIVAGVINPTHGLAHVIVKESSMMTIKQLASDGGNVGAMNGLVIDGSTESTSYAAMNSEGEASVDVSVAGDYLLIVTGSASKTETTANYLVKVALNGTDYCEQTFRASAADVSKIWPYGFVRRVTLTPGTYTISVQGKVNTTGTMNFIYGAVACLPLSTFANYWYNQQLTNIVPNFPGFQTGNSLTAFLEGGRNYLVIASALVTRSNGMSWQTVDELGTILSSGTVASMTAGTQFCMWAQSRISAVSDIRKTFSQQVSKSAVGAGGASMTQCAIIVIQEADDSTVHIRGGTIKGGTIK